MKDFQTEYKKAFSEPITLEKLVTHFFNTLDCVEMNDSCTHFFNPTTIGTCRVVEGIKLEKLLPRMREKVGLEQPRSLKELNKEEFSEDN